MKLTANNFDIWIFRKKPHIEYLLLKISQEKADQFFGGGRFWQIPSDALSDAEDIEDAARRITKGFGLCLLSLWAAEYSYTIYNRRRREIAIIPVFATEVEVTEQISLSWEHSESGWFTAEECLERVHFRGLKDGLQSVREYVTDTPAPAKELCLIG